MTKKQKNWLISLSAIVLASGVAIGVALPLTMCSPAPTPGPGPTPIEKIELKSVGNYGANATTDQDHPIVYINKDQKVDGANVLRFMEIEVGSNLENTYGCTGWTVFGTKIESSNASDSSFGVDINDNTIPKTVLVDDNEKNIKNIGSFRGSGIASLVIPNFIEIIGKSAFQNCSGLTSLDLSGAASLQIIAQSAFENCLKLTGTLIIPANVTSIGDSAFYGCSGLTGLDLSGAINLQTIIDFAFSGCTGLTGTLTIPASITSIGFLAFFRCILTKIEVNPLNQKYVLASYKTVGDANVVIEKNEALNPNHDYDYSYDCVGSLACGELTVWNDPSIKILNEAMMGTSLTKVIIQDNITEILGSFHNCANLTVLNLSAATSLTKISYSNNVISFSECPNLTNELIIPASLTNIPIGNPSITIFNQSAFTSLIFKGSPSNDIDYEVIFKATISQTTVYEIKVPMTDRDAYLAKFPSVPQANIIGV